ncbi:NlpC/P60 family protein [Spongiactinospora sp. TRM90649]|uniref:C40 family peptidase n=1 Tax=Spongiactinospora sp. TRM90649 TaxID=3031114 RepID=UPI0023F8F2B6|nr:NlpC/P60 family protein [Spongiactinospora sp. TRM90649]MDF5758480.1 NlpC/P60 family protein [Spongiactinospora sp. TRM90649]
MRIARVPVAAGLVLVTLTVPFAGAAAADPRPTLAQARAKLAKLNAQADKVVDQYNTATDKQQKAKKKYASLNTEYTKQLKTVDGLRRQLVGMAVTAYQGGELASWPGLLTQQNPGTMLGGLASVSQLTASRSQSLNAFDVANRDLRAKRTAAEKALDEAKATVDEIEDEKKKVEELIKQQTKLLRRLNSYNKGNPDSQGMKYTGSASGNARQVLAFAYAQLGKPYRYGGTGPSGWDCSGLTQASWRAGGVTLPRTTWQQWAWGAKRKVNMNALEPGDLLFSHGLGHVGIYAGGGKMVHAPQTGDVVKITPLSSYGNSRFVGAIRP